MGISVFFCGASAKNENVFTNGSHSYFDGGRRTGGRVIPELKPLTAEQEEVRNF